MEVPVPLLYKDEPHDAQLLTYLELCKRRVGLLFNFNSPRLMSGFRRLVI